MPYRHRRTFTVPGVAGQYAPEVLVLQQSAGQLDEVAELSAVVHTLPATAVIEVDLLEVGGSPEVANDWHVGAHTFTAVGLQALVPLAKWYGVRLRAKSGGTAGAADLSVSYW